MRLPIINKFDRPLTVFMEPICDQFEIPPGGKAIVRIDDGYLHSIEFADAWVTVFDDSTRACVEVVCEHDMRVDDAITLASTWLHNLGAITDAKLINRVVEELEPTVGYLHARKQVFISFHDGFKSAPHPVTTNEKPNDVNLAACYQAGAAAARLNKTARRSFSFPGFGKGPLDTGVVRSAFSRALD